MMTEAISITAQIENSIAIRVSCPHITHVRMAMMTAIKCSIRPARLEEMRELTFCCYNSSDLEPYTKS